MVVQRKYNSDRHTDSHSHTGITPTNFYKVEKLPYSHRHLHTLKVPEPQGSGKGKARGPEPVTCLNGSLVSPKEREAEGEWVVP